MNRVVAGGGVLALGLLAAVLLFGGPGKAEAHHQCGDTGSPLGPFDLQAYEAKEYKNTYARALELAGFNQLFPELPSFTLPRIETGDRAAGSDQTKDPYIPPVLLKAIAWLESGWAQADYAVPYGGAGSTLISHDCGYGIMQVTTGMQNISGVPSLDQAMIGGHYAFNIARGARILAGKWNQATEYRPIVGGRDPAIIEDWYFALWSYNGFAFKNHPLNPDYQPGRPPFSCGPEDDGLGHDRGQYPYQELVLGCVAHPPIKGGAPLWEPQEVHLPDLSDPKFAEPLKVENWNACSYEAQCAPMDIPTPNTNHTDPTAVTVTRTQLLGTPLADVSGAGAAISLEALPGSESLAASVTIANHGSGVLAWRLSPSASWIKLSRVQGVSLGTDIGSVPQAVKIYADARDLTPGTYNGAVTVESLYASGVPQSILVTLDVSMQAASPRTGDVSGDGKSDVVYLCCSDYASTWLAAGNGVFSVGTFRPWAGYGMRSGSWRSGDFNGDGKTDLIHHCCPDYANIWLSNGDGTFSVRSFQPWPDYDMAAGLWHTGDFNGDGKTDLVHLWSRDYANVWLSSGDGSFTLGGFRPWEGYDIRAGSWRTGDFDGDGKTDLIHMWDNTHANIWLSSGDGTFSVRPFQPWPEYDIQAGSWQSGDFNGDGKTDLIHRCCSDYANVWFSAGDGAFSVAVYKPWPDYDMQVGSWQLGDFNGDGKTDLVHVWSRDYANIWLSSGDGTFTVAAFQPWPGYDLQTGSWQSGDFNGDGWTDLLHLCCHYVQVWRALGNGSFAIDAFQP